MATDQKKLLSVEESLNRSALRGLQSAKIPPGLEKQGKALDAQAKEKQK